MHGDEAGAAHRRGRDGVRRDLPRRAHVRPQGGGRRRRQAGDGDGHERRRREPPPRTELRPDGEDRGADGAAAATAGRRRLERHAAVLPVVAGERPGAAGSAQPVLRAVDAGEPPRRRRVVGGLAGDLRLDGRRAVPPGGGAGGDAAWRDAELQEVVSALVAATTATATAQPAPATAMVDADLSALDAFEFDPGFTIDITSFFAWDYEQNQINGDQTQPNPIQSNPTRSDPHIADEH